MPRPRHRRLTRRRRLTRGLGVLTALTLTATATAGALAYRDLDNNIVALDTTRTLGTDRPDPIPAPANIPQDPLNVLLIGSDDRKGSRIGGQTPGLSDTTMLVHINAERTRITGVSIPRDSMVERPDCTTPDGRDVPGELAMFNTAYALGGPGCTQRTVEQLTGIRIDHFAVLNLAGFARMVDAIGGVPICVPREVNDTIGDIYLPAGAYTATGRQALGYVRERHTMSANGDLGRVKRQQAFLAALAAKAISTDTLTNPPRLYRFLTEVTSSLTTDPALASLSKLASLGAQLADVSPANIEFLTIPTVPYAPDPNRLVWSDQAPAVWSALRHDRPLPGSARRDRLTAQAAPGATASPGSQGTPGVDRPGARGGGERAATVDGLCG